MAFGGLGVVNCAFFVSGFIFLIDSCKALLIIYHVKWRYIKWKLLLLLLLLLFDGLGFFYYKLFIARFLNPHTRNCKSLK